MRTAHPLNDVSDGPGRYATGNTAFHVTRNQENGAMSAVADERQDRQRQRGWTPIHPFFFKKPMSVVQVLLEHEADAPVGDDGITGLHSTALDCGASTMLPIPSRLHTMDGHVDACLKVGILIKGEDSGLDSRGNTTIHNLLKVPARDM